MSKIQDLFERLISGNRVALGKAITLIESRRQADQEPKSQLLELCSGADSSRSVRIGISGLPGAGKSTFIECFGMGLIANGHRLAVLAVDPTSDRSGGSILGDKTRMDELSMQDGAFIRPSPNAGVLGGVTEMTRETILVCEAAGYDIVLVETVGVGQAEFGVATMVDYFLLLTIAGAGDVLQGMKRGIMEMADGIVVNKADGDGREAAIQTAIDLRSALSLMTGGSQSHVIRVVTASAISGEGIQDIWQQIVEFIDDSRSSGKFDARRKQQQTDWFENAVDYQLRTRLAFDDELRLLKERLRERVEAGDLHPYAGASAYIDAIRDSR